MLHATISTILLSYSSYKEIKSIEINSLGPNVWISHDWAGAQPCVGLGGHRPTHWGARPSQLEWVSPRKRALVQILLCFIICQTIPQLKKAGAEVLGWHGYTWSAVVKPVGRTAKFSKTTLEEAYGRVMNIQISGNSSGGDSCSQHSNCTLPQLETSVALCCDKTAHFKAAFYSPKRKVHLCNDHAV